MKSGYNFLYVAGWVLVAVASTLVLACKFNPETNAQFVSYLANIFGMYFLGLAHGHGFKEKEQLNFKDKNHEQFQTSFCHGQL